MALGGLEMGVGMVSHSCLHLTHQFFPKSYLLWTLYYVPRGFGVKVEIDVFIC